MSTTKQFRLFDSKYDMLNYESERNQFYMWEAEHPYLSILKYIFSFKYRNLKKIHDSYCGGGFYIIKSDRCHLVQVSHLALLDKSNLKNGTIICERDEYGISTEIYIYKDGEFIYYLY